MFGPARWPERILCGIGSLPLVTLDPLYITIGIALIAVGVLVHLVGLKMRRKGHHKEPNHVESSAAAGTPGTATN